MAAVSIGQATRTTQLTVGMLGNRLRHEILTMLAERPCDTRLLASELGQEDRAILRSVAFLAQARLITLVARKRNPTTGGRKYIYKAVPNVRKVADGLTLTYAEGETFAQVLERWEP